MAQGLPRRPLGHQGLTHSEGDRRSCSIWGLCHHESELCQRDSPVVTYTNFGLEECSRLAFAKKGRSLQASDLTEEVHTSFMNLFGEGRDGGGAGCVRLNVNLFLHLIFKKFYRDE